MSRRELPARRRSWTQRVVIARQTCYLTCGEYDDGTLGEIFLTVAKEGTALRALLDSFAISFSLALQNGHPLKELIGTFRGLDFAPQGIVLHDNRCHTGTILHDGSGSTVTHARSIVDWAMQEITSAYLRGHDENQAIPHAGPAIVARCSGQENRVGQMECHPDAEGISPARGLSP